jgi:hypothetical protein
LSDTKNTELYDALRQAPPDALKQITGGRLKGMSDINPQWRYEAMTKYLGPVGFGWRYEIVKLWREDGANGIVFAFAQINVYIRLPEDRPTIIWSEPIPGLGGSELVSRERDGLYSNDEGYKMAVTDALGTALKTIGVGADIYRGRWDGSKYNYPKDDAAAKSAPTTTHVKQTQPEPVKGPADGKNNTVTTGERESLIVFVNKSGDVLTPDEIDATVEVIKRWEDAALVNNGAKLRTKIVAKRSAASAQPEFE